MSYLIKCRSCGRVLTMSDSLFTGRIQGNLVAVRCKHCQAPIAVDGNATTELTSPLLDASEELRDAVEDEPPQDGWRNQALSDVIPFKQPSAELEPPSGVPVTTSSRGATTRAPSSGRRGLVWTATLFSIAGLGVCAYLQGKDVGAPLAAAAPSNAQTAPRPKAEAPPEATAQPMSPPAPSDGAGVAVTPDATSLLVTPDVAEDSIPASVSRATLDTQVNHMLRRAARCHEDGGRVGDTKVLMTFAPDGHVSDARLEGNPVADAALGRCILDQVRATVIPEFEGSSFTIRRTLSAPGPRVKTPT